jgi:hypothetical protein
MCAWLISVFKVPVELEISRMYIKIKISGVGLWVLRPLTGLLYQPRIIGDDDCEEIGGIQVDRGNRSTRIKPAPAPLCPPQIPYD